MKCLSCGQKIPDTKRMCDECAAKMISKLTDQKKEEEKPKFQPPKNAPKGVVRIWKPKRNA